MVPLLVITGLIVIVIGVIILGPGSGDPEAPAPVWNPEADRLLKEVMVQNEADPAEASGVKVRRLEQVISRYPQTQAAVKARELVERLGSGR